MMTRWRSLFVTGAMLLPLVLFATGEAFAQPPKVATPTVTTVDHDTLRVSWTRVLRSTDATETNFASSYTVHYAKGAIVGVGADTVLVNSPAVQAIQSVDIDGLEPNEMYAVVVVASDGTDDSPVSSVATGTTDFAVPTAPAKPTVRATDHASLHVRWVPNAESDGITTYTVFYKAADTVSASDLNAVRMEVSGDDNETDLTGLMPATKYAVGLVGTNPKGTSALSGVTTATTEDAPTPDRVNQPTVTSSNGQLMVDWFAPAAGGSDLSIASYMVEFQEMGDASWLMWNPSPTVSEVTLTGLTNGKTYNVRVKAKNDVGGVSAEWSVSASGMPMVPEDIVPPPLALTAPTGVVATGGDGMIDVSWNAVEGADSYKVSWMPVGGTATTTTARGMSHTIDNVTNGTTYEVQVSAMRGTEEGPASAADTATPVAPKPELEIPELTLVADGHDSLTVSWNAVEGADHYNIDWQLASGGIRSTFDDVESPYTITGLTPMTEYQVSVCAHGGEAWACSDSDDGLFATTAKPEDPPPTVMVGAPTEVKVVSGNQMLMVSWNKPDMGADMVTGYMVQYQQVGGAWTDHTGMMEERMTTIGSLINGVTYNVRIAANSEAGMGPYSEPEAGTPMPVEVPALPLFGMLALGAGLVAAGRRRLHAQRLLKN